MCRLVDSSFKLTSFRSISQIADVVPLSHLDSNLRPFYHARSQDRQGQPFLFPVGHQLLFLTLASHDLCDNTLYSLTSKCVACVSEGQQTITEVVGRLRLQPERQQIPACERQITGIGRLCLTRERLSGAERCYTWLCRVEVVTASCPSHPHLCALFRPWKLI